jgi:hypothetical protein
MGHKIGPFPGIAQENGPVKPGCGALKSEPQSQPQHARQGTHRSWTATRDSLDMPGNGGRRSFLACSHSCARIAGGYTL